MSETRKRTWAEVKFRKAKAEVFGRRARPTNETRADVTHAAAGASAPKTSYPRSASSGAAASGNPFPKALSHNGHRPGIRFGAYDALKPKKVDDKGPVDADAYYARIAYEEGLNGDTRKSGDTTERQNLFSAKSSAQVETLVSPRKEHRRNPLTVRLSDQERDFIKGKAVKAGVTINSYVRASALGSDFTPPRDPALTDVLRRTLVELTRQGTNLNQIAHRMNLNPADPAMAERALGVIYPPYLRTLSKVRSALAQGPEP